MFPGKRHDGKAEGVGQQPGEIHGALAKIERLETSQRASSETVSENSPVLKKIKVEQPQKVSSGPPAKKVFEKPKRPMSAYNFFFRDERARILAEAEAKKANSGAEVSAEGPKRMTKRGRRCPHGIVSFKELGAIVSKKWKEVPPDVSAKYKLMAKEDSQRYRSEMDEYYERQDAELNALAFKQNEISRAKRVEREKASKQAAQASSVSSAYGTGSGPETTAIIARAD